MLVLHSVAAISVLGLHPAALTHGEMNSLTCCQVVGRVIRVKLLKAVFSSPWGVQNLGEVTCLIEFSIIHFFKLAESPVCVESQFGVF